MQQLVQGIHHFQDVGFAERSELFSKLKDGQQPEALLITCADSRIVPSLITNSEPGQLFVVRNVGNMVPCHNSNNTCVASAVEYGVKALGIEDLIVCGHTSCGAMKALLTPPDPQKPTETPCVAHWLRHADATLEIVREHYQHLEGKELVNAAAQENVLVQLENLRTMPIVASRLASGKLRLHGWMFHIDTGEVHFYDPQLGQFSKIHDVSFADYEAKCGTPARLS